eukprot:scaffold33532_cov21-Tisochrysis_lutea.AAC.1
MQRILCLHGRQGPSCCWLCGFVTRCLSCWPFSHTRHQLCRHTGAGAVAVATALAVAGTATCHLAGAAAVAGAGAAAGLCHQAPYGTGKGWPQHIIGFQPRLHAAEGGPKPREHSVTSPAPPSIKSTKKEDNIKRVPKSNRGKLPCGNLQDLEGCNNLAKQLHAPQPGDGEQALEPFGTLYTVVEKRCKAKQSRTGPGA